MELRSIEAVVQDPKVRTRRLAGTNMFKPPRARWPSIVAENFPNYVDVAGIDPRGYAHIPMQTPDSRAGVTDAWSARSPPACPPSGCRGQAKLRISARCNEALSAAAGVADRAKSHRLQLP